MKQLALAALAAVFLVSCQTPSAKITPKPDIAPVQESNERTKKSITKTRTSISGSRAKIKESQEASARGATKLDEVESALETLLEAP